MNIRNWFLALALATCPIAGRAVAASDILISGFEGNTYGDWTVQGTSFASGPSRVAVLNVTGFRGMRIANSFADGDAATGEILSPPFKIERSHISFLIGGGRNEAELGVELVVDGQPVRRATGNDSGHLRWVSWEVSDLQGRSGQIRIFDAATGGWGHISVDEIVQTDRPRSGDGNWRLETYRRSAEYLREPFRPGYHFTPELNWMNDPNGLVFFDGEYHLFYQFNPHGNEWGHMSWGHAVSGDLVHWKHLPIALQEEYGTMAFSGSAVVDEKNSSGFGNGKQPPLVALFTGHGHDWQTQDIAYSRDRGRTWIRYAKNPVLDLGLAEFRDPKVFWHAPSQRWVMVVSLAPQKRLQFYASTNLKDWTLLSEFGPAGVADKPNWECPDLFELPIKNEPGKSRWILKADMGSGAVAGGSGGEYFTGTFDGKTFKPDSTESQWIDFGRDFYAPVSWSNVPASDGRCLWIGWMNNWETCNGPTWPWRGAMSIPREVTLRRIGGQLRLCQSPVRELKSLRGEYVDLADEKLADDAKPLPLRGQQLEIIADFEPGTASSFGMRVRKGGVEQTIVGFDSATRSVFIDRTKSGRVDFHPAFAGRHAGKIALENGRLRLHVFVDACSVETFAGRGEVVLTDLIFPDPDSDGVEFFAEGGDCKLIACRAWKLKSAWESGKN